MRSIPVKWHFVFWVGLILLGVAALSPYYANLFKATMHRLVFLPVWLIATYGNLNVLLPKLWDRGKKWTYGITLFTMILGLTVIQRIVCISYIYPKYFWLRTPTTNELNPFWIGPLIQFFAFISLPIILSIGLRIGWNWYQESYKAKLLVAEKQAAELSYLKAQVNPHFLFNTLNSLYGLSMESSKKVPGMILKLSDLLSYSLYESNVNSVSIKKEMDLIENFIALEKERYEDRIDVKIEINTSVNLESQVAPLMFLPLVENAFKHGIQNTEQALPILISLNQQKDTFTFAIENEFETNISKKKVTEGGIGLSNLRKRLKLRYPDKHRLKIKNNTEQFKVTLEINLDE